MNLHLGHHVMTSDGSPLELADVIVHPRTRSVTHVVLQPRGQHQLARLVAIERIRERDGGLVADFESAAFSEFPNVEHSDYERAGSWPVAAPGWAIGIDHVLVSPYYYGVEFSDAWDDDGYMVSWDRIPADQVEIRRESVVRSSDGHRVGTVEGFACSADDRVTHVILARGHLWGSRDIVIPISAARQIGNDEVVLTMTRDLVADLPDARVHRKHRFNR